MRTNATCKRAGRCRARKLCGRWVWERRQTADKVQSKAARVFVKSGALCQIQAAV